MQRAARPFIIIGIVLMISTCACAALTLFWPGVLTRWEQAPAPPEAVTRLDLGEAGEVFAVTSNGTLYEFHFGTSSTPASWTEVSEPSGNPPIGASCFEAMQNYLILPPPGKVASQVSESCVYMESGYRLDVALLENGEVWTWEYERYAYSELMCMFGLLIAFVLGIPFFVMGFVLKVFQKVKRVE